MKKTYIQPQMIVCDVVPVQPLCLSGSNQQGNGESLTHSRGDDYDDAEESRLW